MRRLLLSSRTRENRSHWNHATIFLPTRANQAASGPSIEMTRKTIPHPFRVSLLGSASSPRFDPMAVGPRWLPDETRGARLGFEIPTGEHFTVDNVDPPW